MLHRELNCDAVNCGNTIARKACNKKRSQPLYIIIEVPKCIFNILNLFYTFACSTIKRIVKQKPTETLYHVIQVYKTYKRLCVTKFKCILQFTNVVELKAATEMV